MQVDRINIAILGSTNVGKSTLISVISSARPKIANYPFTTLVPNLGVVEFHKKKKVFCDIPGLIEGAYTGKGLGDQFLRHVKRSKVLIHMLDATSEHLEKDYLAIRNELEKFDKKLLKKPEIIVINKIDAVSDWKKKHAKFIKKYKPLAISAVSKKGIKELLGKIFKKN